MTSIVIELKPTSEFMLASDAIVQAINRLAAAMEAIKVPPVAAAPRVAKTKLTSLTDLPAPILADQRPAPAAQTRDEIMRLVATAPVAAGFEQVQAWAVQRGISFGIWDDLPAVNARRVRLGLPPFKREFPVKGRFG